MKYGDVKKKKLPNAPGVYFFLGLNKKVLYVGKATSLKDRVKSYFSRDIVRSRGPLIEDLIEKTKEIDYKKTDSVLEALILEANLIKKHQPIYNTREKSDKSFNYVVITKEDFPRVIFVRGRELEQKKFLPKDIKYIFGPFPQSGVLKEAIKIIRRLFPFRDKCKPKSGKPCFNRQIGLCPGVCSGEASKTEYARTITNIKLFFEGKKKALIKKLEKEMKMYAKAQKFEKAGNIKKTIFALNHIQDIALIKNLLSNPQGPTLAGMIRLEQGRQDSAQGSTSDDGFRVEGYDVAHISGTSMVGVMTVVEDGEVNKSEYRKFIIRDVNGTNDTLALKEMLARRLKHNEWRLPNFIVVDGGVAQKNAANSILKEHGIYIPIVSVVKDERHRAREILGDKTLRSKYENEILLANSEAHRFAISAHRRRRQKFWTDK